MHTPVLLQEVIEGLQLKAADIQQALQGLCKDEELDGESRRDMISLVYPYVHLPLNRSRKISPVHACASMLSSKVMSENEGIRLFRERIERLARMQAAIKSYLVFACSGWFHLLHDISRSFDFPEKSDDSVRLRELKRMARNADPNYAQVLLAHAQTVMTQEELRYDWPDKLKE